MAELFGTAAGVLQVAEVGFNLASTLYKYASTVKGAERDIKRIARDVKLTSKVLERTHQQLKADQQGQLVTDDALFDLEDVLDGCREAFQEVDDALQKSMKSSAGKSSISFTEKLKWPLKQDKLEVLRANLEKLKTTLLLMLSVLAYGSKMQQSQVSKTDIKVELSLEKLQIQNLIQAKDEATSRYEELSAAFAKLETRINDSAKNVNPPSVSAIESNTIEMMATPPQGLPPLEPNSSQPVRNSNSQPHVVSVRLGLCASAVSKLTTTIDAATKRWESHQILEHDGISLTLKETTEAIASLRQHAMHTSQTPSNTRGESTSTPDASAPNHGQIALHDSTQNQRLQDYQMQLMLLEKQNKKRLLMARQEADAQAQPGKPPSPFAVDANPPLGPPSYIPTVWPSSPEFSTDFTPPVQPGQTAATQAALQSETDPDAAQPDAELYHPGPRPTPPPIPKTGNPQNATEAGMSSSLADPEELTANLDHAPPEPQQASEFPNVPFGVFGDDKFTMGFANLDSGDALDNFDFDSFLNSTGDNDGLGFDANFAIGDKVGSHPLDLITYSEPESEPQQSGGAVRRPRQEVSGPTYIPHDFPGLEEENRSRKLAGQSHHNDHRSARGKGHVDVRGCSRERRRRADNIADYSEYHQGRRDSGDRSYTERQRERLREAVSPSGRDQDMGCYLSPDEEYCRRMGIEQATIEAGQDFSEHSDFEQSKKPDLAGSDIKRGRGRHAPPLLLFRKSLGDEQGEDVYQATKTSAGTPHDEPLRLNDREDEDEEAFMWPVADRDEVQSAIGFAGLRFGARHSSADSSDCEAEIIPFEPTCESGQSTDDQKPLGILKKPTEKFPKDPNPVREGVAPLANVSKTVTPPGAKWTKIYRHLVDPKALEAAHERFEECDDCVIVRRLLTKDEIQELMDRTQEIRGERRLSLFNPLGETSGAHLPSYPLARHAPHATEHQTSQSTRPRKKKGEKMLLSEFLAEQSLGSWADEVDCVQSPRSTPVADLTSSNSFHQEHGKPEHLEGDNMAEDTAEQSESSESDEEEDEGDDEESDAVDGLLRRWTRLPLAT